MIILTILIVLILIGIGLVHRDYCLEGGISMIMVFGIYLISHIVCWSVASYEYNQFILRRNSFEQTLNNARQNNNPYEIAGIAKEVSNWNIELVKGQYKNKLFFLKDYIDDRIDLLEPIK